MPEIFPTEVGKWLPRKKVEGPRQVPGFGQRMFSRKMEYLTRRIVCLGQANISGSLCSKK